jgi:uncharacterized lipoprotein
MRSLITSLGLAAALLTAGCHLRHSARVDECLPVARYDQARSVPPLRAPEGLPAPNTKNALKMPDEVANAKPHKPGSACLDAPPDFFSQKPKSPAAK